MKDHNSYIDALKEAYERYREMDDDSIRSILNGRSIPLSMCRGNDIKAFCEVRIQIPYMVFLNHQIDIMSYPLYGHPHQQHIKLTREFFDRAFQLLLWNQEVIEEWGYESLHLNRNYRKINDEDSLVQRINNEGMIEYRIEIRGNFGSLWFIIEHPIHSKEDIHSAMAEIEKRYMTLDGLSKMRPEIKERIVLRQ